MPRLRRDQVAVSSTSLRVKTFEDPYDKYKWTSTQHFHVPIGTRPRHASSKGALSVNSNHTSSRRHLPRPTSSTSLRPQTPVVEPHNNLRRQAKIIYIWWKSQEDLVKSTLIFFYLTFSFVRNLYHLPYSDYCIYKNRPFLI